MRKTFAPRVGLVALTKYGQISRERQRQPGCCRTDANQSQFAAKSLNLCGTELAPFGESGGTVDLEIVFAVEGALLIEMIMD